MILTGTDNPAEKKTISNSNTRLNDMDSWAFSIVYQEYLSHWKLMSIELIRYSHTSVRLHVHDYNVIYIYNDYTNLTWTS